MFLHRFIEETVAALLGERTHKVRSQAEGDQDKVHGGQVLGYIIVVPVLSDLRGGEQETFMHEWEVREDIVEVLDMLPASQRAVLVVSGVFAWRT